MRITVPDPSLVLLVGPSGSGKSTFAAAHFAPTEVVSSDALRAMLADDPADQGASAEAFRLLRLLVGGRLARRLLTVVDATNLRATDRRRFVEQAVRHGLPVVAIAFDMPLELYHHHNSARAERIVEPDVVDNQSARMAAALASLPAEGYAAVFVIDENSLGAEVSIERQTPSHNGVGTQDS